MKNTQAFIMPLTILLAVLILGGSYYLVERNKQKSIEKQNQTMLEEEKKAKEDEAREEMLQQNGLRNCMANADKEYYAYMELNGTKKDDGTIWAQDKFWDRAEKNKKDAIDVCNERYRNKSFNGLDTLF